jgi:TonB-dependent receptor
LNSGLYTDFSLSGATSQVVPTLTLRNGATPVSTDVIRSLSNYSLSQGASFQSRPWTTNETKKGLIGSYKLELEGLPIPVTLQAGAALELTDRDITRITLRSAFPMIGGAQLATYLDEGFTKDLAFGFGPYQTVDAYKITSALANTLTNYFEDLYRDFSEENQAVYLRADIQATPDLLIVGGVRWEQREIDGVAYNRASPRSRVSTTNLTYDNYYPSLMFKYTPSFEKSLVVRGGISRTVGHPDYADLIGTATADDGSTPAADGVLVEVSPGLKPYYTTNYDLSFDYYLKNSGVLTLALFKKDVKNYIVDSSMTQAEINQYAAEAGLAASNFSQGTIKRNGAKSGVQGIELGYSQALSFLPKPFDGLNIQTNFTVSDIDGDDNEVLWAQQRGAASKTFNFVLGYRVGRWSITSSTNWTGETVASGLVNSEWITGTKNTANPALDTQMVSLKADATRTDIKVEYAISSRYKVYAGIQNIFGDGRDDFWQGWHPSRSNVRLARNHFEFGEPYYNLGIRGTF